MAPESHEEVRQRIDSLYARAENATGNYNATRAMAAATRRRGVPLAKRSGSRPDPALDAVTRQWFDAARAKAGPTVPAALPADRMPDNGPVVERNWTAAELGLPSIEPETPALPAGSSQRPVAELTGGTPSAPALEAAGTAVALPPAAPVAALPAAPVEQLPPGAIELTPPPPLGGTPVMLPTQPAGPSRRSPADLKADNRRKLASAKDLLSRHSWNAAPAQAWGTPQAPAPGAVQTAAPEIASSGAAQAPAAPTGQWTAPASVTDTGPLTYPMPGALGDTGSLPYPIPGPLSDTGGLSYLAPAPQTDTGTLPAVDTSAFAPGYDTGVFPAAASLAPAYDTGAFPAVPPVADAAPAPTYGTGAFPAAPVFQPTPAVAQAAPAPAPAFQPAPSAAPAPAPAPASAYQPDPPAAPAPAPTPAFPSAPPAAPAPAPAVAPAHNPAPTPRTGTFSTTPFTPRPTTESAHVVRAAKAIAFAAAQVGKPCVWGATGPDSFDCSSLTQGAWRTAGVELPRAAHEQATAGTEVALAAALPGDLVVFFEDDRHVGLYVGNGTMIHAPGPGATIREESVYGAGEAAIHRVIRPA
ncbi:NlpC/P60 family protein [Streptomyces sp. NBC_01171]|uniref:C40 family peptidase n=1 Tax=Streptomyces sp. NBC_01171 TaxID=2903757 RepID=UPI003864DC92|nr:NlpC/P60 family protein [Streptomyces sp. NBC_01171]